MDVGGRPGHPGRDDLVYIHEREDALRGCDLYVGDGATLDRDFMRRRGDDLIGHAPFRTQLSWCRKEGDERARVARLREMADERAVEAGIAHDGMELVLR